MDSDDQYQSKDPKLQNVYNPLRVMRDNEEVLCEIKRHPIGIIGVYIVTGFVVLAAIAVAVIAPSHMSEVTSQTKAAFMIGALILTVMALLYAYVAWIIYSGNRWILTDDSLTQVTQDGLFHKHSSQLSLANLEDVTADQNGIIQSIFGYGVLKAETAGERSKFVFVYCPQPNDCARKILEARENFIMNEPEAAQRANDKLMTPGMMQNFAGRNPVPTQPQAGAWQQPPQQSTTPPAAVDPTQGPAPEQPQYPPQANQQ